MIADGKNKMSTHHHLSEVDRLIIDVEPNWTVPHPSSTLHSPIQECPMIWYGGSADANLILCFVQTIEGDFTSALVEEGRTEQDLLHVRIRIN